MSSGDQPRFYHLRPVEGKGLKPIVLREAETVVVGRGERLGISSAKIGAKHLECRLTLSPVVAVELRASEVVYVKDRFGVLKMLKANFIGYLKMGEVLYLCANKQPQFGYILTEGMPKTRKGSAGRGDEEPAPADAPRAEAKGEECIDLLNDPRESSQQNAKPTEKHRLNGDRSSRTRKLTRERALRRIHVSCCPPMTRSSSRSQNRKARPELRKRVAEGQVKRQQGEVRADVAKKR
jgi:hypothetical protein